MIKNIVNIDKSIIKDYINEYQYPWNIINKIETIIKNIDKSKYTEYLPNMWIGKNVIMLIPQPF